MFRFSLLHKNSAQIGMISRRDNLLVRPWQDRRYDNHRRKVKSAAPAIDNAPPPPRYHVAVKLKKQQKETERCKEIEKNNFILLRKMSHIMKTSRVDNSWTTPQPSFLNRISMYETPAPKMEDRYDGELSLEDVAKGHQLRKLKCLACNPPVTKEPKTPEERVPWEPPKPPVSRRQRSKSVPVLRTKPLLPAETESKAKPPRSAPSVVASTNLQQRNKVKSSPPLVRPTTTCGAPKLLKKRHGNKKSTARYDFDPSQSEQQQQHHQSIILSKGSLNLAVNFPLGTYVKIRQGPHQERVLMHGLCQCKSPTLVMQS